MNEKIKSDFNNYDKEYCFLSSDYFNFFGYNRHSDFKRFLDQEKFYENIYHYEFSKINSRSRSSFSIDRILFIELCKRKKIDTTEYEKFFYSYIEYGLKNKTEKFLTLSKATYFSALFMFERPAGKFYTYSLNTVNIAKELMIDPFDLYKFCAVTAKNRFTVYYTSISEKYDFGSSKIPLFSFDHKLYTTRFEFLVLLKIIISDFPLSDMQKNIGKIYYDKIKIMLHKQTEIDFIKQNAAERAKVLKIKKEFNPSQDIKDMYRKACKLYHPDKNPAGEEIFKIINKAYQEGNASILRKYSSIS